MIEIAQKIRSRINALLAHVSLSAGLNLNLPTYICAKMTMQCNSRCAHCNIWNMAHPGPEMTTVEWFATLESLRGWLGEFSMVFTGGEALMRPDMVKILNHAVKLGIRVELLTNGLMVSDDLAGRVVSAGVSQVTLSLDGVNPATHDRFRGGEGFHAATVSAIHSFASHREKSGRRMVILLKNVISSNSLDELVDVALWARDHGCEVLYQPIEQNYGEAPDPTWYTRSPLWIADLPPLRAQLVELKRLKLSGVPIRNTVEEFDTILRYFDCPEELMDAIQGHDTRTRGGVCRHAVTNFVIESNGDVKMCFKMEPIGNLRTALPQEVWQSRARCWAGPCDYR